MVRGPLAVVVESALLSQIADPVGWFDWTKELEVSKMTTLTT
jgi:hypothetical protein